MSVCIFLPVIISEMHKSNFVNYPPVELSSKKKILVYLPKIVLQLSRLAEMGPSCSMAPNKKWPPVSEQPSLNSTCSIVSDLSSSGARLNDSWDRTSSIIAHGLTNSLRRLRLHHRIALQPGSGPPEPTRRPADCRGQTLCRSVDRISSSLLQMMTHQCRQRLDKVLVIIE